MTRGLLASGVLLALFLLGLSGSVPALADASATPDPSDTASPSPQTDAPVSRDEVACACGCGIFDMGDAYGMVPMHPSGGMVWFRYTYMNQNQNWERFSPASSADNQDKRLSTSFYTVGAQYTLNSKWTLMGELPMFNRSFTSTDDGTVQGTAGSIYTANIFSMGDARLMMDYTGLSPDMSTGLIFGLKLPTGQSYSPTGSLGGAEYDRDSLPGTGSTDLVLGAYHLGSFMGGRIPYQVQFGYDTAMFIRDGYRVGNELDLGAGLGYNLGPVIGQQTTPWLTLLGSFRQPDTGVNADTLNSGYSRIFIAPGLECRFSKIRVYGDVEFPIVQYVNTASSPGVEGTAGQLVPNVLYKLEFSHDF